MDFGDIRPGQKPPQRLSGVIAGGVVEVVALQQHGPDTATLTYRTADGRLGERIITRDDDLELAGTRTCCADGAAFRLASEARRLKWAHLADPFTAVETSNVDPYPHQIDAVYNHLLPLRPLRYLLADDPGAGKTIMSGLLIRELMLRGDVERCLVVAPGSLVEQWQDELWEKFGLEFELMSRQAVETSRSGNPFAEKNLLIARLDQLARAEDLKDKLAKTDWDLVIVDEAHKMSAQRYGRDFLEKTKRFQLGELLRDATRHLLLLTATPHNGKHDDFLAFMTLLDPVRFEGCLRDGKVPKLSDVMRRKIKENLLTFEGKRLFPKRTVESLAFDLSEAEDELYEAVTDYVQEGMDRAQTMLDGGRKRGGFAIIFRLFNLQRRLASSPAAIYQSLCRRREKLTTQAQQLRDLAAGGEPIPKDELPEGVRFPDVDDFADFDPDDYSVDELDALEKALEDLEMQYIDPLLADAAADEMDVEAGELDGLVDVAKAVFDADEDTKWNELRDLLNSPKFRGSDEPHKLIVFTEYRDTLNYVAEKIRNELGRPEAVEVIHGGVWREDRRLIQRRFWDDPSLEVLVATDAAGEGVNLHVANKMVNYDLPWNPNRIEQRFGRIHRIGQKRPCYLWNLVAHETREGKVFQRLLSKIEQQREAYGDQAYDVLGRDQIRRSLRVALLSAMRDERDPVHERHREEIVDAAIGEEIRSLLEEETLLKELDRDVPTKKIRRLMEQSQARKLQPWFVQAFFTEALRQNGGHIAKREEGRFELTRVPAVIRTYKDEALGHVHDRYSRVAFGKNHVRVEGGELAYLIAPGTALLSAVVNKVLADHGKALEQGATLVAPDDLSTEPRLLVYLDHKVTDGWERNGQRQIVSQKAQFVEIDQQGNAIDAGSEPYLGYAPIDEHQCELLEGKLDSSWLNGGAESAAQSWAIEHLAASHFNEMSTVTRERVAKVRQAVKERLESEVRYLNFRLAEVQEQEDRGETPSVSPSTLHDRMDRLAARRAKRHFELDLEEDLHNSPPTIVSAALVIPQGMLDSLGGKPPDPEIVADRAEIDRRGIEAVCAAERALKKRARKPTVQEHDNLGFDIESVDCDTGMHYFITVKSYRPKTTEVNFSAQLVQKAKSNPERWRLAMVSVPEDPNQEPTVRYVVEPFKDVTLDFGQARLVRKVSVLLRRAVNPC